ncbi:hypothetical protein BSK59_16195 [Paenibacillus odorifer]|uniref:hypothetical protein n=1 Tax=Paenibacillus odorifer TaxID=189426 RepID=UPI00096D405D|nr:hypothetical protein [Paenibacillus odorifer]OME54120.1 hypothetical protein BSK59_16195 [Paenibacillus odorifer]
MIVIEGKSGKSVVLQNIINNQFRNRSMYILDTVGVKGLSVPEGVSHAILDKRSTVEQVIEIFTDFFSEFFDKVDWIVFEVNANILDFDLSVFKDLDRRYTQNFIVTVQNDSIDEVNVYYA